MSITALSEFVVLLLGISLCTERLVTILKTMAPRYLHEEAKTEERSVDMSRDRRRRLLVQFIAFLAAWATAGFFAAGDQAAWLGSITIGTATNAPQFPVWLVAILASGGSALWASILGYTSAVKDVKKQLAASEELQVVTLAREVTAGGGGVRVPPGGSPAPLTR